MDFLIDTHVLVWIGQDSPRLSNAARTTIEDDSNRLLVSGVTAWEFADLRQRNRLPAVAQLEELIELLSLSVLDGPAALWRRAGDLPNLHGDPADRMLVAHALELDLPLMTADATIRTYPVRTLW